MIATMALVLMMPGAASAASAAAPIARRVCVLQGVDTYAGPNRKSRVAKSTPAIPSRLGAGTYVTLEGGQANGFVRIRTLAGGVLWVQERTASGRASLCVPASVAMNVCGDGRGANAGSGDADDGGAADEGVPMHQTFNAASPIVARLPRGTPAQAWEYFEDQGRWTFVEHEGRVGFVASNLLCHAAPAIADAEATEHFHMIAAPANAACYQQHRTRAASEIRRIVIHNSENSLKSAVATFQHCNPQRPTSAHVAIDRDGKMYRLVEDKYAAFHTGANNGGMNAISLGIEVVASGDPGLRGIAPAQEQALLALIRFWMDKYHIAFPADVDVLRNSTRTKAYGDIEYWDAPLTVHRFVSAGRGTDCPKFVWEDSPAGDDAFFAWRRRHFGAVLAAQ